MAGTHIHKWEVDGWIERSGCHKGPFNQPLQQCHWQFIRELRQRGGNQQQCDDSACSKGAIVAMSYESDH